MVGNEHLAIQLVSMWVNRSERVQESFGYIISSFLMENPFIETTKDLMEVLAATKKLAGKIITDRPYDMNLLMSHKAFSSALDSFINCLN